MVTDNSHYWQKFGFFGGHSFLDFINTVDDVEKSRKLEALENWGVLLSWAMAADIINQSEQNKLQNVFTKKSAQTELGKLHRLRELSWRIFSAIAAKSPPNHDDLEKLGEYIKWAYNEATLIHSKKGVQWHVVSDEPNITLIRARLGLAVDDLLSRQTDKIIECGGCTGLFLNQGRGVGRKWCRMQSCGNRAKVSKFRTREAT